MAIRKVRGAPTGSEIPFGTRVVDLGNDKNGKPQTTLVVEWKAEGGAIKKASRLPPSLMVFRDALVDALLEHGSDLKPFADGPTVRAVNDDQIWAEFNQRYPADGDTTEKRHLARRKAYGRCVKSAQNMRMIGLKVVDDVTMIWLIEPESKTATARDSSRNSVQRCPVPMSVAQDRQDNSLGCVLSVPVHKGANA
jgi:hypothetical protein